MNEVLEDLDAKQGKLSSLDCLAKIGSLIANLTLNATENCKLISTASHAYPLKSPFSRLLSMTIMLRNRSFHCQLLTELLLKWDG